MIASTAMSEPPAVTCPDCAAEYELAKFRTLPLVDVLTLEGDPVRRFESRTCGGLVYYSGRGRRFIFPESCGAELAIWVDRDGDLVQPFK